MLELLALATVHVSFSIIKIKLCPSGLHFFVTRIKESQRAELNVGAEVSVRHQLHCKLKLSFVSIKDSIWLKSRLA